MAFANHKGGVGKTTSVANLGACFSTRGRTLLVDLDAQQNLTSCFTAQPQDLTTFDAMTGRTAELPALQVGKNLWLSPAGLGLAMADTILAARFARERILKDLLDPLADRYDYVLLDCPPSLGIITTNALTAATDLFIPLTAEALPLQGLTMLDDVVKEVRRTLNRSLELSGVFVTRYNNRNLNEAVEKSIRQRYGDIVFKTRIRENIAIAEAPLKRETIFDYDRSSNGAADYSALFAEMTARLEG